MQVKEIVKSPEEMLQFGRDFAKNHAKPNLVLALSGDLGAGKTTFLKGFISELTDNDPNAIQSPTFLYLQSYGHVHHFDLYRIHNSSQFESAGFVDYFHSGGICCIEWADRIESLLPKTTVFLDIAYLGPTLRRCIFNEVV